MRSFTPSCCALLAMQQFMTLRLVALSRSQVSFVGLPHAACTPHVIQWPNSGGMSFHITGSRLHFDNCTFNGPTVAMKASPPAPPPEPPTVVSDADQPQATEAPPNWAFEKAPSVMNQLLVYDVAQPPQATNNRPAKTKPTIVQKDLDTGKPFLKGKKGHRLMPNECLHITPVEDVEYGGCSDDDEPEVVTAKHMMQPCPENFKIKQHSRALQHVKQEPTDK